MSTTFKGQIVEMGEIEIGTSKAGKDWTKREVLVRHEDGQYPKEVLITCMNASCDALDQFNVGDMVLIDAHVESRKSDSGRYFTNVNGWRVSRA